VLAAITATYVYGDDLLCFHDGDRSADRHYTFCDGLGSVRIVTDDAGAVESGTSHPDMLVLLCERKETAHRRVT